MALIKSFTNQSGIKADFWLITSVQRTRKPDGFNDYKVIIELYPNRETFENGFTSLSRHARHVESEKELTLTELYQAIKEPVMKLEAQLNEDDEIVDVEVNTNYFTDAVDDYEEVE